MDPHARAAVLVGHLGPFDPHSRLDARERGDRSLALIQRFGSALNPNLHFHMLVLDGVYRRDVATGSSAVRAGAPSAEELERLVRRITKRIGRSLERAGLIAHDIENAYLVFDPSEEDPIHGLLGHSITYWIATGPREGQKVFTLQTMPADPQSAARRDVAESTGFSLHAGVAAKGSQRDKIEHLARKHCAAPDRHRPACADGAWPGALCAEDSSRTSSRDSPPWCRPRYHGVFEPASPDRPRIVPKTRAAGTTDRSEPSVTDRQRALTWAQRLKQVLAIEIETCRRCGGRLRVIASLSRRRRSSSGFSSTSAAMPSPSIPAIRAARRPSAICRSDHRSTALGHRAATGPSWFEVARPPRPAPFPAQLRRFRRPNDRLPGRLGSP